MKYNDDFFTKEYYKLTKNISHKETLNIADKWVSIRDNIDISNYGSLNIEIVKDSMCQLNCEHCYHGKKSFSNWISYVWFDIIKKIIDQATSKVGQKKIFDKIALLWWEPTLHPQIKEIIDYILSKGSEVIIATNWMKFIDIWFAEKIFIPGVILFVHMPFKGMWWKYIQDEIVWVKWFSKQLNIALQNLLKIKKINLGMQLFGDFVINKKTILYAYKTYVFCRENNIEPFFERMRIDNDKTNRSPFSNKKELEIFLNKIFEYDKKKWYIGNKKDINKISYLSPPIVNSTCLMFKTGLYISFDENGFWNCTSCCGQGISHWNILNKKISEILDNKNKISIFNSHKSSIYWPCSVCKLFTLWLCEWGCRWNANIRYSCPKASDPNCIFIKNNIKNDPSRMKPDCNGCDMYHICYKK